MDELDSLSVLTEADLEMLEQALIFGAENVDLTELYIDENPPEGKK